MREVGRSPTARARKRAWPVPTALLQGPFPPYKSRERQNWPLEKVQLTHPSESGRGTTWSHAKGLPQSCPDDSDLPSPQKCPLTGCTRLLCGAGVPPHMPVSRRASRDSVPPDRPPVLSPLPKEQLLWSEDVTTATEVMHQRQADLGPLFQELHPGIPEAFAGTCSSGFLNCPGVYYTWGGGLGWGMVTRIQLTELPEPQPMLIQAIRYGDGKGATTGVKSALHRPLHRVSC